MVTAFKQEKVGEFLIHEVSEDNLPVYYNVRRNNKLLACGFPSRQDALNLISKL